jgi:ribosome-binding factor A
VSTRTDRMADLIRDEISRLLLRDIHDPRIGFVTLTGVSVSPDLRAVRVFVSVLGDEAAREASLKALTGAAGYVQKALFRNLRLRYSPAVTFRIDDSLERGERIERALRRIHGEPDGGTDGGSD